VQTYLPIDPNFLREERMAIEKSLGQTPTEQYLSQLCERTFLNIWSYPNPYKADGKELCDLLVVFENTVFLFFDRESRRFDKPGADTQLTWDRWKKEAITKQIQTAAGAKRYVLANRDQIYLTQKSSFAFRWKFLQAICAFTRLSLPMALWRRANVPRRTTCTAVLV
jgi:hypothetical protein